MGQYLQGNEFADTFRKTRNSFEQLHALLGTTLLHPCFLLMNRTLYYLTTQRYIFSHFYSTLHKVRIIERFQTISVLGELQFLDVFMMCPMLFSLICGECTFAFQAPQKQL